MVRRSWFVVRGLESSRWRHKQRTTNDEQRTTNDEPRSIADHLHEDPFEIISHYTDFVDIDPLHNEPAIDVGDLLLWQRRQSTTSVLAYRIELHRDKNIPSPRRITRLKHNRHRLLLLRLQLIQRPLKHHLTFVDDPDMRDEAVDLGEKMA